MVIDSGADYTLLPKRYAGILGINLTDSNVESTIGVGGSETVYQYQNLTVKIGDYQIRIPAGFLERDDLPSLLGRLDCLEKFRLIFENKQSRFEIPQK